MKKVIMLGVVLTVAFAAYADDEPAVQNAANSIITSQEYVDYQVSLKQPLLEKKSSANFIVTYPVNDQNDPGYATNTPTSREIAGTWVTTTADDLAKVPTVGAVNSALATKQDNIGGGTANTVITNTGTAGVVGSKPVYNESATYTNDNVTALLQANQANTAIQNGLNGHLTCATYAANHSGDSNYCLTWQINTLSGPYTTHAAATPAQSGD